MNGFIIFHLPSQGDYKILESKTCLILLHLQWGDPMARRVADTQYVLIDLIGQRGRKNAYSEIGYNWGHLGGSVS